MSKSVTCSNCGQTWPREPALEVPCPQCSAAIGQTCKRPSGHTIFGAGIHNKRDQAALSAGVLKPCPKSPHMDSTRTA